MTEFAQTLLIIAYFIPVIALLIFAGTLYVHGYNWRWARYLNETVSAITERGTQ